MAPTPDSSTAFSSTPMPATLSRALRSLWWKKTGDITRDITRKEEEEVEVALRCGMFSAPSCTGNQKSGFVLPIAWPFLH